MFHGVEGLKTKIIGEEELLGQEDGLWDMPEPCSSSSELGFEARSMFFRRLKVKDARLGCL